MQKVFILILAVPLLIYFAKPILRKLNIPKATISRAKLLQKEIWDGANASKQLLQKEIWSGASVPSPSLRVKEIVPKKEYLLTFAYMVENDWKEHKFTVPPKIYDAIAVGDEGILKHHYTEIVGFEKFDNMRQKGNLQN